MTQFLIQIEDRTFKPFLDTLGWLVVTSTGFILVVVVVIVVVGLLLAADSFMLSMIHGNTSTWETKL